MNCAAGSALWGAWQANIPPTDSQNRVITEQTMFGLNFCSAPTVRPTLVRNMQLKIGYLQCVVSIEPDSMKATECTTVLLWFSLASLGFLISQASWKAYHGHMLSKDNMATVYQVFIKLQQSIAVAFLWQPVFNSLL